MGTFPRLASAISRAKLTKPELAALKLALHDLQLLKNTCKRRKNAPKITLINTKPVRVPKKSTKQTGPRLCKHCETPLPHLTHAEWDLHMMIARRKGARKKAHAYWRRVGWDKFLATSVAARRKRAYKRKADIFYEMAPHAASVLGPDGVYKVIDAFRNPKNGYMHGYKMWRRHIRHNYPR